MTLIIAAQGKGFVVLGADTRETVDARSIRVEINLAEKIIQITPHVAILFCGDVAKAQYLVEKFSELVRKTDEGVSKIAEDFARFCKEDAIRDSNVPTYPDYFPSFAFIIGGLNKSRGKFVIPKCYKLGSTEGFKLGLCKEGFALDGKPMLAYYLFEKNYRNTRNVDGLCKLVAQTLYDTARVDGDVGGPPKMVIIRSGGLTWCPDADIQAYIQDKW
jgi:20S proteasome alpha/beta subunit